MAPKDEYEDKIKDICKLVRSNQNLQIETLAVAINKIFVEAFRTDVYDENKIKLQQK